MILLWIEQKKNMGKRTARRACLSGKFVFLRVLVFNEIEDYGQILLYYFSCKWLFRVFCIVWCVIATSSWIFPPNVEECDFK